MVEKDEEPLRFWHLANVYAMGVVPGLCAAFWTPSL